MSELLVNTIKKADGTGSLTVPAESGTVVTTASPSLGRRNLIINGAMQVAQRGTSFTGITNSEGWGADRFRLPVGASSGTYTVSQESDGPDGYAKSFKALVTATGSTGGSNYALFRYKFEGQDLQHLKYGTSGAEQITVSFWFKSNKTGTYQVTLRNLNSNRMVGATYNVSSADTWEQKIITFPADTTGSFTNDNGDSLRMDWWLHSGATFNSGSVPTVWATYNSANQAAGQTVNLADTINNYAQITGVQLEVGSVSTPYEHRSFGDELALCQRYYEKSYSYATLPGSSSQDVGRYLFMFNNSASGYVGGHATFAVNKRANPTVTTYAPNSGTSGQASFYTFGSSTTNGSITTTDICDRGYNVYRVGQTCDSLGIHFAADAEL